MPPLVLEHSKPISCTWMGDDVASTLFQVLGEWAEMPFHVQLQDDISSRPQPSGEIGRKAECCPRAPCHRSHRPRSWTMNRIIPSNTTKKTTGTSAVEGCGRIPARTSRKTGADKRKPPKPGTRSKCWVGAHDRKVRGKMNKVQVKGHFRKIPKGKKRK